MHEIESNRRVTDLVNDALDLAPHARDRFLDQACAGEPGLRREVESLLAEEATLEEDFLVVPAVSRVPGLDAARRVLFTRLPTR